MPCCFLSAKYEDNRFDLKKKRTKVKVCFITDLIIILGGFVFKPHYIITRITSILIKTTTVINLPSEHAWFCYRCSLILVMIGQDPTTRVRSRLYATYSYAETGEHHGVAPRLIHDS